MYAVKIAHWHALELNAKNTQISETTQNHQVKYFCETRFCMYAAESHYAYGMNGIPSHPLT